MMAGKYDVKFDPDYDWDPLYIVARKIRKNSRVLEFGPANGRFTKYLTETMYCTVDIVEYDRESGQEAAQFADKACLGEKEGNIEFDFWRKKLQGEMYDYILFADVLEHLRNPVKALESCRNFLKPHGSIIISIPNIAHNAIILDLLKNEFSYMDTGLLDRTHVFFFTKKTILSMLQSLGYYVYSLDRIIRKPEDSEFNNSYQVLPQVMQSILKNRDEGETYQFIITCGPNKLREISCDSSSNYRNYAYNKLLLYNRDSIVDLNPYVFRQSNDGFTESIKSDILLGDNQNVLVVNLGKCQEKKRILINFLTGLTTEIEIKEIAGFNTDGQKKVLDIDTVEGNFSKKMGTKFWFYTLKPFLILDCDEDFCRLVIRYDFNKIDNVTIIHNLDDVTAKCKCAMEKIVQQEKTIDRLIEENYALKEEKIRTSRIMGENK